VSNGKVKLPDVRGMTYDDARATLNAHGFLDVNQGSTVETSDPGQDTVVTQENPTPGQAYDPGTPITLNTYQYVAPPPPTTPITTPTTPVSTPPSSPTT
jgi:serine/threonine-protein kinase